MDLKSKLQPLILNHRQVLLSINGGGPFKRPPSVGTLPLSTIPKVRYGIITSATTMINSALNKFLHFCWMLPVYIFAGCLKVVFIPLYILDAIRSLFKKRVKIEVLIHSLYEENCDNPHNRYVSGLHDTLRKRHRDVFRYLENDFKPSEYDLTQRCAIYSSLLFLRETPSFKASSIIPKMIESEPDLAAKKFLTGMLSFKNPPEK